MVDQCGPDCARGPAVGPLLTRHAGRKKRDYLPEVDLPTIRRAIGDLPPYAPLGEQCAALYGAAFAACRALGWGREGADLLAQQPGASVAGVLLLSLLLPRLAVRQKPSRAKRKIA